MILHAKVEVVPGGTVPALAVATRPELRAEVRAGRVPSDTTVRVHPPSVLERVAGVVGASVVARTFRGPDADEGRVATYETEVVIHRALGVATVPRLVSHVADAFAARPSTTET